MFTRYRKLISTDFSRAVSRPRSPVRAAATRDLDDTAPWLARWTMPCQGTLPLAQRTRLDRPSLALALPMQVQLFENCREGGRVRQEHVALSALPLDRTQRADRDVRHRVSANRRGPGYNMKEAPCSIAEE